MTDYDWIWLNITEYDYDWIWMNVTEYDKKWLNMTEYDGIWLNMNEWDSPPSHNLPPDQFRVAHSTLPSGQFPQAWLTDWN